MSKIKHNSQNEKANTFKSIIYYFSLILFIGYCIFIIWYTILSRHPYSEHRIEYHFMWAYCDWLKGKPGAKEMVIQNVANILFFIPFGFLFPNKLPFCKRKMYHGIVINKHKKNNNCKNLRTTVSIGILFSVLIEITQYITYLGLSELDDVICNGLGTLIGYLIWLFCRLAVGSSLFLFKV